MAGFGNVAHLDDFRKDPVPSRYSEEENAFTIPTDDGGVIIQFGMPNRMDNEDGEADFSENLAERVDPSVLAALSWEILDGIQADETSRTQWISDRTRGLDLLAVKVESPRADIGGSGAAMDGMSTIRHPLLLEACIKFSSNFKREMLPASGPTQVKNEGQETAPRDAQAEKLADLMNRNLTQFRPEYYPDTDRMGFDIGFSGMGFKKLYHCPIRRSPVSDSVEGKDLIVSNNAKSLQDAQRVTHQITMTKSMLKRMQYVGAYRNIELGQPDTNPGNRVTMKQGKIQGIDKSTRRPQDHQYTIYECYTTIDLKGFEHTEDGQPTGLPMPYKITIDKMSRQILEIRRNWNEDADDNFEPRRVFVAFPFVPMFGFYATGLLHILGNTTQAITGAWRILLDSGMFANFPGFLYAKNGARQDDLNFRIPPGGGAAVDLNGADDIRKVIMSAPYKEPGAATMQLVDNMASTGARVGGSADFIDPSNIRQNMPVGTTMMLVEQAAQTISAVHERQFVAQSQELQILLELFREDPKSLWRHIQRDGVWTYEELVQTLETYTLVPVADPNTPTHIHRIMKMTTLKQLEQMSPGLYDPKAVDTRILRSIKIDDPETLFAPPAPPGAAPPDPAVVIAQATKEVKMADIQARLQIEQMKATHTKEIKTLEAHIAALELQMKQDELELKTQAAQQAEETKRLQIETTADTAAAARASAEYIAKITVAKDAALQDVEHEHAETENEKERAHTAEQAEKDRTHAIALEKAKPRPKPAKSKKS